MDEYQLDNITVSAGGTVQLAQLDWTPFKYGKLQWQIGVPDRDSTEYYRGDDFRHWGMWFNYPADFPDGIDCTIGQDDWSVDWNYLQCNISDEAGYLSLAAPWYIRFNVDRVPTGTGYLRIAVAGARQAKLKLYFNSSRNAAYDFGDLLPSDSANPRSGSRGYYREYVYSFDCSMLNVGSNFFRLQQYREGEYNSILYDSIRLELPYFADLDGDLDVTFSDFAIFSGEWFIGTPQADIDNSGTVDFEDLSIMAGEWLQ